MGFMDVLSQSSQTAIQKAKVMNDVANLRTQIGEEQRSMTAAYLKLGETYCALHGAAPEADLAQYCTLIEEKKEAIASLEEKIRDVRGVCLCPKCGTECSTGLAFCGNCGTALPRKEAPQASVCPSCGKPLPGDVDFCPYCGSKTK